MTEAELARWKETTDMFCDMDAHGRRAYGTFLAKDYDATVAHLQAAERAVVKLWLRLEKEPE